MAEVPRSHDRDDHGHDHHHDHHHSHDHTHDEAHAAPFEGWKTKGVQVIPSDSLDGNTPQTPGMDRRAAINFARTVRISISPPRPPIPSIAANPFPFQPTRFHIIPFAKFQLMHCRPLPRAPRNSGQEPCTSTRMRRPVRTTTGTWRV